jgi:hypothetical protein
MSLKSHRGSGEIFHGATGPASAGLLFLGHVRFGSKADARRCPRGAKGTPARNGARTTYGQPFVGQMSVSFTDADLPIPQPFVLTYS